MSDALQGRFYRNYDPSGMARADACALRWLGSPSTPPQRTKGGRSAARPIACRDRAKEGRDEDQDRRKRRTDEIQQTPHHRGDLRRVRGRPRGRMRAAAGRKRPGHIGRGRRAGAGTLAGRKPHARAAGRHRRRRGDHERRHQRGLLPGQGVPGQPVGPLGPGGRGIRARDQDAA